ncbi:MAG TPA: hypothetical protein VFI54_14575 [Solirubrobacteraceae bacterium]|nr:hypothetical protein [Solirubrobacteraceae bacterium]
MVGAVCFLLTLSISMFAPTFRAQLGLCALSRNLIVTFIQPRIGLCAFLLSFAPQLLRMLAFLQGRPPLLSVFAEH